MTSQSWRSIEIKSLNYDITDFMTVEIDESIMTKSWLSICHKWLISFDFSHNWDVEIEKGLNWEVIQVNYDLCQSRLKGYFTHITHLHVVPRPQDLCSCIIVNTRMRRNRWIKFIFLWAQKLFSWLHKNSWTTDVTWTILTTSLLPFCALNVSVVLMSMQRQKAPGFHQKYLNLCSKGFTGLEQH